VEARAGWPHDAPALGAGRAGRGAGCAGLCGPDRENRSLGPVGLALGVWVVAGSIADLWARTGREGFAARLGRLRRLPRADWGKATSHTGLGITIFAVAGLTAWQVEDIRTVNIGETFEVGGYPITLDDVREVQGPNYESTMAFLTVQDGNNTFVLTPEKRIYPAAGMPTTEASIDYGLMRDVYLVIGDAQDDGSWTVRSYIKPLANWLWAGCIIMSLGGLISLTDRRFRVAAGARRAPEQGVPAE
jgi:cytochrome c-type biogenesis protein CcmF